MKKTTLAMAASVVAMTATAVFAQAASTGPGVAMTRAQATAMANEMWTKMDVNKDGVINQADREARRTQKFDQMDTNKDGALSRDEFNAAHPAQGPNAGAMHHGERGMTGDRTAGHMDHHMDGKMGDGKMGGKMGGRMGGMGMMMLHMADANKDGSVTRAEFDAAVKQHLDQVDTNKDGTISPAEHRAAHAAMKKHMKSTQEGAK